MENSIVLDGKSVSYEIKKRNIKNPRMEFRSGSLVVVVPDGSVDVKNMLERHRLWVLRRVKDIERARQSNRKPAALFKDVKDFESYVKRKAKAYEDVVGKKCNKLIFRKMKSKWGSCSSKGNITINRKMMHMPFEHIDYIVFHEMLHLRIRKHGKIFFDEIADFFPDYKRIEKELFEYWFAVKDKK